jgi:hypothetical protein
MQLHSSSDSDHEHVDDGMKRKDRKRAEWEKLQATQYQKLQKQSASSAESNSSSSGKVEGSAQKVKSFGKGFFVVFVYLVRN